MQRLSAVLQYLFFPFEVLGEFVLALPVFLWKFILLLTGKFLMSPWGLLVPITFLVLLFLITQIAKTPFQIAEKYAKELEICKDEDIILYVKLLIQLDEAGLTGLVNGINSEREAVFNACFEGLQNEIKKQQEYRHPHNPFRWERQLSQTLLENAPQFHPAAQIASASLTRLLIRSLTDGIELSHNKNQIGDLQKANRNCIQVLYLLEAANNRLESASGITETQKETTALFHPRYAHPVLMATNGKPLFDSKTNLETEMLEELTADTMSIPNAERLTAYMKTSAPIVAYNSGKTVSPYSVQMLTAETKSNGKTDGKMYDEKIDIVSDYIAQKNPKSAKASGIPQNDFLSDELRNILLRQVSSMPTVDLMRLLHSTDSKTAEEARNILTARDGFRKVHLKLAYELFHPDSAVRKELIKQIPNTEGIPQHIWLLELMNDPDADVRYQAASCLTTTTDPALRHMFAEKGKQDTDQRIVNLAEKISGVPSSSRK